MSVRLSYRLFDGAYPEVVKRSDVKIYPDEDLQKALDWACAKFGDPNAPVWPSQELVDRVLAERANPGRIHGRKATGRGR